MLSPDRKYYLTASDVGAALGRGKFKTRAEVMRRKVAALLKPEGEEHEQEDNAAMSFGRDREHLGVNYAKMLYDFTNTGDDQKFYTKDIFGATPDGIAPCPETKRRIVLEVKAPFKQFYTAKELAMVMPEYYDQIQVAMYCADAQACLVVIVDPDGNITHELYEFSELWFKQNRKALEAFWDAVLESVAYAKAEVEGEKIDARMVALAREIKRLTAELDRLKDEVKKKYKAGIVLGRVQVTKEVRAGGVDWESAFEKYKIDALDYTKPATNVTKVLIDTDE